MLSLILHNAAKPGAACKTTLIVCPLSMLDQWLDEIRNRVKGSQLQVCFCHCRHMPRRWWLWLTPGRCRR